MEQLVVDVRARFHEAPEQFLRRAWRMRGTQDRCHVRLVSNGGVGAFVQHKLHCVDAVEPRSPVQWRAAAIVLEIRVCAKLEEALDGCARSVDGAPMERRAAMQTAIPVLTKTIRVRFAFQQTSHGQIVVHAGRRVQRRERDVAAALFELLRQRVIAAEVGHLKHRQRVHAPGIGYLKHIGTSSGKSSRSIGCSTTSHYQLGRI